MPTCCWLLSCSLFLPIPFPILAWVAMMWWLWLVVSVLSFHPPFMSQLVFLSFLPKPNHNKEEVGSVVIRYFMSVSTNFSWAPNDLGRFITVQEKGVIPGQLESSRVDFPKIWHLGPLLKLVIWAIFRVGATNCWRGVPKSWILDMVKMGLRCNPETRRPKPPDLDWVRGRRKKTKSEADGRWGSSRRPKTDERLWWMLVFKYCELSWLSSKQRMFPNRSVVVLIGLLPGLVWSSRLTVAPQGLTTDDNKRNHGPTARPVVRLCRLLLSRRHWRGDD